MRQLYIPSRENSTVNKFGQFSNELDRWYISVGEQLVIMYLHKEELGMEEGKRMSVRQNSRLTKRMSVWQTMAGVSTDDLYILLIVVGGVTISWASAELQSLRVLPELRLSSIRRSNWISVRTTLFKSEYCRGPELIFGGRLRSEGFRFWAYPQANLTEVWTPQHEDVVVWL